MPATAVTVKLLAADGASGVVPPGVVIVTTLGVVGALAAMDTATVATVPSADTVGGLATVMPSGGMKAAWVAPARSLPLIVRVKLLPTWLRIGEMPYIRGWGRVIRKMFAPGPAG